MSLALTGSSFMGARTTARADPGAAADDLFVLSQNVLTDYGGAYDDPRLYAKLANILDRLDAAAGRTDVHYSITILNSPAIDAFVLPGGQLYVTRGMLALANDSAEAASVMAQQMALFILRHASRGERTDVTSRAQEIEADALGIGIAAKAGFDPFGAARLLSAMARNAELRSAGQDVRPPDPLTSHAALPDRVRTAVAAAGRAPAAAGAAGRDKAAWLASIAGMMYGGDGFVRGRQFLHPRLGFTFMAPEGFVLETTARAMLGSKAGDGQHVRLDIANTPDGQSLVEYLNAGWIANIEDGSVEELMVNGIPAATATAAGDGRSYRLYALRLGNEVYRIIFSARNRTPEADRSFHESIQTFRRLSTRERVMRALRLKVIKVQPGDTVESLAAAAAFGDRPVERFQVLNGLDPAVELKLGDLVKIVE
jgi:predicted Zn-dependent protease